MWQLLGVLLLPVVAHADMNECARESNLDKKNYCMAKYSGSAAFCDRIRAYEYRTQCMRMVIAKQREITYQTPRPPKKEEKNEPTTSSH
jgi:hypothetical protein